MEDFLWQVREAANKSQPPANTIQSRYTSLNHEPHGANGASRQCGTRQAGAESTSIATRYLIGLGQCHAYLARF